jgi:hypothetical protein
MSEPNIIPAALQTQAERTLVAPIIGDGLRVAQ